VAVSIKIDQAAKPAGVAGRAREDLDTGVAVTLEAVGGPYSQYQWEFLGKPANDAVTARSASGFTAATSSITQTTPDLAGTYNVRVSVDSGSGLGATPGDVADITYYAGPVLNTDAAELPRRLMAYLERSQHNVPDAINAGGNDEGWAREWERWKSTIARMHSAKLWAGGRIQLTGGGATILRAHNVATAVRSAVGRVAITFTRGMADTLYEAVVTPVLAQGSGYADTFATSGFTAHRGDLGGSYVDADFQFAVFLRSTT
jgi:hypothetical protein